MTEQRQESKFVLASSKLNVRLSVFLSLSGQANEIKFICISSTCRAGTGATAGGTHVPTNSSAMSQCATVCRNSPNGGCESTRGETRARTYWQGYGYVPRVGGIGGGSAACSFASLQSARDKTQRKVKLALQIFCRQTNLRGGARGGENFKGRLSPTQRMP